jgi:tRNA U34 5-carboxymethylaminomethyl modifying GTPase MnmE/TrmE
MGDPDKTDAQRETSNTTKNAGLKATLLLLEKSMADLNQKMDDSVSVMNKNIDDEVVILNKNIDDKMDGLREDIMSELITNVQHNETNIATNTNKIEQLQTTANKLENLIESNSKANDLIVKAIPILSNEKNP